MESPAAPPAPPATGLPPGVEAGDLLKRFLAHLIDSIVPALVIGICSGISTAIGGGAGSVVVTLVGVVLALGWFVFTWWMFATQAAGPGMRVMKLQLVGLADGRPIGWVRYLLRSLILGVLMGTGIGAIVLIVLLVMNPRRQGLHDLAVTSVVIAERALAPQQQPQAAVGQGQDPGQPQSQQSQPQQPQSQQPQSQPSADQNYQPMPAGTPAQYGPQTNPYRQGGQGSPDQQPAYGQSQGSASDPYGRPQGPGSASDPYGQPQGPGSASDPYGQPQGPGSASDPYGQPQGVGSASDPYGQPSADPYAPSQASAPEQSQGQQPPADQFGQPVPPQGQGYAPAPQTPPPPPVSPSAPIAYPAGAGQGARGIDTDATLPPSDGRPLDVGWSVQLDDGREIEITGLSLLGRNPQPRDGEGDAELIKFADETRTVSKTHLAIGVDANGPYVMDRGSTNGSSITDERGVTKPCRAGDLVQVKDGLVVSFGDHWLRVKRS